jgi:membrane protease YdiL (CAAX protease family)
MMGRRMFKAIGNGGSNMSRGAKMNVTLDAVVAVSFLICALSGVYFLFAPSGSEYNALAASQRATFLFSRTTWDMLHTWSGVVLIASVVVHFAIHWRWVKNVTRKFFLSLWPAPAPNSGWSPARWQASRPPQSQGAVPRFTNLAPVLQEFFTTVW